MNTEKEEIKRISCRLKEIVSLGPRFQGTDIAEKAVDLIKDQLHEIGFSVEEHIIVNCHVAGLVVK